LADVHPDATAALRPALRELLEGISEEPAGASEQWCLSLIVTGEDEAWVQVTETEINLAYPHSAEPDAILRDQLGAAARSLSVSAWEAGRFATFKREPLTQEALLELVLQLFTRLIRVRAPDFTLDVELLRIPR
jgi:hypothetical protein